MKRKDTNRQVKGREGLKKYRITILPTWGPVEVEAGSPEEAEELANHYWDVGWDGEFVTEVEEMT